MAKNPNSPLEAIKAKCRDCVCFQIAEVAKCTIDTCPLHSFRYGRRPTTQRKRDAEKLTKVTV